MNQIDFTYICRLVRDRAALVLTDDKHYLVESRLEPVLKQAGLRSIRELVQRLRAEPDGELQQCAIEALVTTETMFFRDTHPFEALKQVVLPELLRQRQSDRCLNVWCA
ncbi:MAG: protein-glutamate O-methyltransferase CheR, partial [Cyanobacteria bacterium J06648_11]